MPRAPHPCPEPGCTTPVPAGTSRCPAHTRARDKARGTRQSRGYDAGHDRARRTLAPLVAMGHATCWRCGLPITPGTEWHVGHDDHDRSITRGPEHAYCNLSAAGRARHGLNPAL